MTDVDDVPFYGYWLYLLQDFHTRCHLGCEIGLRDVRTFGLQPFRIVIAYLAPTRHLPAGVIFLTVVFVVGADRSVGGHLPTLIIGLQTLGAAVRIFHDDIDAALGIAEGMNLIGLMLLHREITPVAQDDAERAGEKLLASVGIESLADARAMNADSLQKLLPPTGMANVVLDGYFMVESADDVFTKGVQAQVPLLAGWNSLEGTPLQALHGMAPTVENYKKAMRPQFGNMTDEIFEAYGILTDADVLSMKSMNLASDLFTGFPTWKWADIHSKTSKQPVYRYKYMHPRPQVSAKMGNKVAALAGGVREKTEEEKKAEAERPKLPVGAVHSADIEYAMGTLDTNEFYDWQEEDYAISKLFLNYYANFCKFGNPNGEGLPTWTPINGQEVAPVMYIDVNSAEKADAATENAYRTLEKFYLSR